MKTAVAPKLHAVTIVLERNSRVLQAYSPMCTEIPDRAFCTFTLSAGVASREEAREIAHEGYDSGDEWYDLEWPCGCTDDVPEDHEEFNHTDEEITMSENQTEDLLGATAPAETEEKKPAAKKAPAKKAPAKKAPAAKDKPAPKPKTPTREPVKVDGATVAFSRVRTTVTTDAGTLAAYFRTEDLAAVKAGKGVTEKRGKMVFDDLHDAWIVKEHADLVKKALAKVK